MKRLTVQQRQWRRALLIVLTVLGMLIVPREAAAQSQSGVITVPRGTTVTHSVSSVNDNIVVEGAVTGDVTSWNGNITINGQVNGDVVSYAGRITLGATASVGGSVLALDGVERQAGAQIAGQTLGNTTHSTLASLVDLFVPGTNPRLTQPALVWRIISGALLGGFLFAFAALWSTLWPHRTRATAATLRALPGRSILLGLLSTLLIALLLPPLGVLLAASVVGLPILVVLLVVLQIPYVYGLAAFAHALTERRAFAQRFAANHAPLWCIAAVSFTVAIVTVISLPAGVVCMYLLAIPGFGAVLLSRGGIVTLRIRQANR